MKNESWEVINALVFLRAYVELEGALLEGCDQWQQWIGGLLDNTAKFCYRAQLQRVY